MASYVDITNTLNFSVAFKPTSAFPLDARSMFGSYQAAAAAAATAEAPGSTNTIYYFGQHLTVFENDVVATYQIQPDGTLKAIGAEVIGDEKSVTIGDSGTIGLKSFGLKYFKYIAADTILDGTGCTYPDAMPATATAGNYVKVSDVWYVYIDGAWAEASGDPVTTAYYELTDGWKAGLEPKVMQNADNTYELAWYEPSSTTVEGLQSAIGSLQGNVDTLNDRITNVKSELEDTISAEEDRAKAAEEALVERVGNVESDINTLNADASTEGSIKYQIAQQIANVIDNPDDAMNSIQELVDWIDNHAEDALELNNNVTANATAIKALETLVGTLPEGISATTVIGYIAEAVKAEETRALAAEKALSDRIGDVESIADGLGTASTKNIEDFATAAQGAKADTAVQSVTSGDANGYANVDGVQVKIFEQVKASVTQLGSIKPDGTSIVTNDEGVASVSAVDASKVTGLDTKLTEVKDNAVTEAKEYGDETYIPKSSISTVTDVADSVEAASDGKVISEKLLLSSLEWKTTM